MEIDLHLTDRTGDFACTCLVTEVLASEPFGRIWVANHFPDYQLDHERERRAQAVAVARELESLVAEYPGHVIVAGDMDADATSDSMRFWTGRHVIDGTSVRYRSAWEAIHPSEPLATYLPRTRTKRTSTGRSAASTTSSSGADGRAPPRPSAPVAASSTAARPVSATTAVFSSK